MQELKELIIMRKQCVEEIEKMKRDNVISVKESFITNRKLNDEIKKYFDYTREKSKVTNRKKLIFLFTVISLIIIILTSLILAVLSGNLQNVINIFVFKLISNTFILSEFIFSILLISKNVLKYDNLKNNINCKINECELEMKKLKEQVSLLEQKHLNYCKLLAGKEKKKELIDGEINNKLFSKKSIVRKSDEYIEKHNSNKRIRIK